MIHGQEYINFNRLQPNAACLQLAVYLVGLPCVRGSWRETGWQALSACSAMLRCVRKPSMAAKRMLAAPGGAVQAFLLVCVVVYRA